MDVSAGWRPFTSQARGAKQPRPEPTFCSPVITQDVLNMVQMLPPKAATPSLAGKAPANSEKIVDDSDEQGEDSSSSSASSDSSESSEEETSLPTPSSIMVMNAKSHVVHAVRPMTRKSSFNDKGETFEVLCGSSVLDSTVQMIVEIPQGAGVCQRKACLSIDHF